MRKRLIPAGEIVNTHGVRGEVKILTSTDTAGFLLGVKRLFIDGGERRVLTSRVHKGMLLVLFEGVADVNDAMRLKGREVCFAREDVSLPEGSFFLCDIIGARVVREDGSGVGELTEIIEGPAQRVYVVKGETEHLIPAVPEFILATDAENGLVTVRLIDGM